jgi:hypothetical protein
MLARLRTPLPHQCTPVVAIKGQLLCVQLPVESSPNLCLSVAVKADYDEIDYTVVRWIFVYMVDLHGLAFAATHTASAIR